MNLKLLRAALLGAVCLATLAAAAAAAAPDDAPGAAFPKGHYGALNALPDWGGVWTLNFGGPRAPRERPELKGQYLADYQAWQHEVQEKHGEVARAASYCRPPGMPGIMGQPYPMEFLLTPGLVTIVIEAYTQVRHIYTDGRPLPDDPDPKFHGTSIGHWEGDTLVVETVGFSPQTDIAGNTPHSDKMKIVERFRLADPDTMTIETTVTDAEALAAPWVSNRTLRRHRAWTIAEYICEENNRNSVDSNGKAAINIKK